MSPQAWIASGDSNPVLTYAASASPGYGHALTSTRVRQAKVLDAADIAAVHVRSWQVGYRGLLPDELLDGLSIEARTRDWTRWLDAADDAGLTLVGQADGHTVGFCSVATPSRDPDAGARTAEIGALYV